MGKYIKTFESLDDALEYEKSRIYKEPYVGLVNTYYASIGPQEYNVRKKFKNSIYSNNDIFFESAKGYINFNTMHIFESDVTQGKDGIFTRNGERFSGTWNSELGGWSLIPIKEDKKLRIPSTSFIVYYFEIYNNEAHIVNSNPSSFPVTKYESPVYVVDFNRSILPITADATHVIIIWNTKIEAIKLTSAPNWGEDGEIEYDGKYYNCTWQAEEGRWLLTLSNTNVLMGSGGNNYLLPIYDIGEGGNIPENVHFNVS